MLSYEGIENPVDYGDRKINSITILIISFGLLANCSKIIVIMKGRESKNTENIKI